ncbi:STAS-like domain-containing protein [Sphingomonas aurantiaca]|uniref:STAS-like domain-containing protein n=1 Tax=Sphingomonas aurantiaca TaxID=185949 RepID=UPI003364C460
MVIRALDYVPRCYSAAEGFIIANILRKSLSTDEHVSLSFERVSDVPSTFVNSAIVSLLADYSEDWIKSHLSIVDVNTQIATMVQRCLANGITQKKEGRLFK